MFPIECERVQVSVTFREDMAYAEYLARSWARLGVPVEIGGPATGQRSGNFTPGMYLRHGYVITSRGCPNNCWFCDVPKREGPLREINIADGWNVLDDNLLACSDDHIRRVFAMLDRVRSADRRVEFTGGLEAARLKRWHAEAIYKLRPKQVFCAYDTPDDYEPLVEAGKLFRDVGFGHRSRVLRCYVLIGYQGDTLTAAEKRLREAYMAGFWPMAMLFNRRNDTDWRRLQRQWARPALIAHQVGYRTDR